MLFYWIDMCNWQRYSVIWGFCWLLSVVLYTCDKLLSLQKVEYLRSLYWSLMQMPDVKK